MNMAKFINLIAIIPMLMHSIFGCCFHHEHLHVEHNAVEFKEKPLVSTCHCLHKRDLKDTELKTNGSAGVIKSSEVASLVNDDSNLPCQDDDRCKESQCGFVMYSGFNSVDFQLINISGWFYDKTIGYNDNYSVLIGQHFECLAIDSSNLRTLYQVWRI